MAKLFPGKKAAVVSDETVWGLYASLLEDSFEKAGIQYRSIVVPQGEKSKSLSKLSFLYQEFADFKLNRDEPVIAFGGGVVGDLAGFAAATYMRGVPYVQVPTTLLSQVDSSVGGKVAINIEAGKNLVGNFYQPQMVVADTSLLSTLAEREFSAGLSEVIKYSAIGAGDLLVLLEDSKDKASMAGKFDEIIKLCCQQKAAVVEKDEKDTGLRMILNFGHTFGHAIEKYYSFEKYNHGEAVALGMVLAVKTGILFGETKPETYQRLVSLLKKAGLKTELDEDINKIIPLMISDKKNSGGLITLVLIHEMGKPFIKKTTVNELLDILKRGDVDA